MKYFFSMLLLVAFCNSINSQTIDTSNVRKNELQYLTPRLAGHDASINILIGDLNNDGLNDAFVSWCINATEADQNADGGNALMNLNCIEEGYTIFINKGNALVLTFDTHKDEYTDKGFSFTPDKIENGKIICSTDAYADDDARCCPSLHEQLYLIFQNGKLIKPEQIIIETKSN